MSSRPYLTQSPRRSGGGLAVLVVGLLLAVALLALMIEGCTISEVVLYKTVNNPVVSATPSSE